MWVESRELLCSVAIRNQKIKAFTITPHNEEEEMRSVSDSE